MSVSPLVNRLNPPPVPETPTGTDTLGLISENMLAASVEIGATVLDPSITTVPRSFEKSCPKADPAIAKQTATTKQIVLFIFIVSLDGISIMRQFSAEAVIDLP